MKKILSTFLLVPFVLLLFSTALFAQTGITSIESSDGYGQIYCLDYSADDLQKELANSKMASLVQTDKNLSDSGSDSNTLNEPKISLINGNRQRMYLASGDDEYIKFSMGFRNDHGPVFLVHYPLE